MRPGAAGAVHSRRRPVMTSGQSCARTKGSTRERFIFRAGQGAGRCRAQLAAFSRPELLGMRASEGQCASPSFLCFVLLRARRDSNNVGASASEGGPCVLRLAASASEQRPFTPHAHPLPPPSPHLPATALLSRARPLPSPARSSSPESSTCARTSPAARATAASPRARAASAPGRYSSTTSVPACAAHQLHSRARPAGELATTAPLQIS